MEDLTIDDNMTDSGDGLAEASPMQMSDFVPDTTGDAGQEPAPSVTSTESQVLLNSIFQDLIDAGTGGDTTADIPSVVPDDTTDGADETGDSPDIWSDDVSDLMTDDDEDDENSEPSKDEPDEMDATGEGDDNPEGDLSDLMIDY